MFFSTRLEVTVASRGNPFVYKCEYFVAIHVFWCHPYVPTHSCFPFLRASFLLGKFRHFERLAGCQEAHSCCAALIVLLLFVPISKESRHANMECHFVVCLQGVIRLFSVVWDMHCLHVFMPFFDFWREMKSVERGKMSVLKFCCFPSALKWCFTRNTFVKCPFFCVEWGILSHTGWYCWVKKLRATVEWVWNGMNKVDKMSVSKSWVSRVVTFG